MGRAPFVGFMIFPSQLIQPVQQMEDKGLFNRTITSLAETLYNETTLKTNQHLVTKALSLGIPVSENYTKERNIFVITQSIMTLVDQMVMNQKKERSLVKRQGEGEREDRSLVKREGEGEREEKSTLNYSPKCLLGNLNIAVLIYQMFCPKMIVWDIIEKVTQVKKLLQRQDGIFEVVHLQSRINQLQNLNKQASPYKCHCQFFNLPCPSSVETSNCHHCFQQFHPGCQSSPLFCNSCFLRFCLMDLRDQIQDPFNTNKEIKALFFGYIKNQYKEQIEDLPEHIYFHVVRFNLDDFQQQADRKLKYLEIRLSVVDKIFPDELVLPTKSGLKLKKEANWFWALDSIEYYFFLNHNEIKYTTSISKHAIIVKVPHRMLQKNNNIFVMKSVKRNPKYKIKDSTVLKYFSPQKEREKVLMVGILEIKKKKNKPLKNQLREHQENALPDVTVIQSSHFIQFVEKNINQVDFQIVNLYNCGGSKKIQQPVRSFGCHHIECFDFVEFKESLKLPKNKSKPKKPSKSSLFHNELQNCIEICSHSSSVIQLHQQEQNQEIPASKSPSQVQSLQEPAPSRHLSRTSSADFSRRRKVKPQKQAQKQLLCPICQRRLLILYSDPLFKQIIFNSGFYKKVKIFNNGEYTFQDIPKSAQTPEEIEIQ